MREMDFSEKNLANRWLGVKGMWDLLQGETRRFVKGRLERLMRVEVSDRVGCGRYERSGNRRGYRNGRYVRDLLSSYGWISGLEVPRVREGGFQPSCLERYRRRQRVVDRVLLEAFLLGHATRKVRRLCRSLFGAQISPQAVSNVVRELDAQVKQFHGRRFGDDYRFVYLDGLWITLSKPVKAKKVLLVALGVRLDGGQELLGFQVADSESESWWWGFLSDLKQRGLGGWPLEVIVSDGAAGLAKAIQGLYPRVKHQLCTFHKAMDLGAHLANKRHRQRMVADALHIFGAATQTEARRRLRDFSRQWLEKEPKAVRVLQTNFDRCLIYLDYPDPTRSALKTNNPIERYLEEIRRRIIPMRAFNNTKSVERIIYGIIAYVLNQQPDMPTYEFTHNP